MLDGNQWRSGSEPSRQRNAKRIVGGSIGELRVWRSRDLHVHGDGEILHGISIVWPMPEDGVGSGLISDGDIRLTRVHLRRHPGGIRLTRVHLRNRRYTYGRGCGLLHAARLGAWAEPGAVGALVALLTTSRVRVSKIVRHLRMCPKPIVTKSL